MKTKKGNIPSTVALIVAAGTGQRFGPALPKQYASIAGKTVLEWTVEAFNSHPEIAAVYIAVNPEHKSFYQTVACNKEVTLVEGGATRQESVRKGLDAIHNQKPQSCFNVLIHDAARPGISHDLITKICEHLVKHEAVAPFLPVVDTLIRINADGSSAAEDRNSLYQMQTPQGFRFQIIHDLHNKKNDKVYTDDISLAQAFGHDIAYVRGDSSNIKITWPEDILLMESVFRVRETPSKERKQCA